MSVSVGIRYFLQNCFGVRHEEEIILFDVPVPEFFGVDIIPPLRRFIRNQNVRFLTSHYHCDHFYPAIGELLACARNVEMIVPAGTDFPAGTAPFPPNTRIVPMAPFERRTDGDFSVRALKSNDEGLAFMILTGDVKIYFGGDLARWTWPEMTARQQKYVEAVFDRTLRRLALWRPHIVFSNADPRLPHWTGAMDIIRAARPEMFVPMHIFHRCEEIDRLAGEGDLGETRLFRYRNVDDAVTVEIPRPSRGAGTTGTPSGRSTDASI